MSENFYTIGELCSCTCSQCTTQKDSKVFNNGKLHCCNAYSCRAFLVGLKRLPTGKVTK